MKYKSVEEVKCPFCLKRPICVYKSISYPDFYCEDCKIEIHIEPVFSLFGNSKTLRVREVESNRLYCKKHNEIYKDDKKDYCEACHDEERVANLKLQNFTESQLKFISEYGYRLEEDCEKMLGIYKEDD